MWVEKQFCSLLHNRQETCKQKRTPANMTLEIEKGHFSWIPFQLLLVSDCSLHIDIHVCVHLQWRYSGKGFRIPKVTLGLCAFLFAFLLSASLAVSDAKGPHVLILKCTALRGRRTLQENVSIVFFCLFFTCDSLPQYRICFLCNLAILGVLLAATATRKPPASAKVKGCHTSVL